MNAALGLATKKLAGIPNAAFSRLALYVLEKANVEPIEATLLLMRLPMNPELAQALPLVLAKPVKNLVRIGSGTVPATPPCAGSAKLPPPLSVRFFCALRN